MDDVQKGAALSAIRTLLGVLGGAVAAHGYMDDATVQLVIGAVMTLVPLAWGIWDKKHAEAKTVARVEEAYSAGASAMPMPTKGDKP